MCPLNSKKYIDWQGRTKWTTPDQYIPGVTGQHHLTKYPYRRETAEKVYEKYQEGLSLREIGKLEGCPSFPTICNWMTHHPDFALRLKTIRKTRGLIHEEKALEIAENATVENVPVAKLQVETHKWVAEASDPETYGKKKSEGAVGPTTIIINTGVPDAEGGAVEVKCEVVPPQVSSPQSLEDLL